MTFITAYLIKLAASHYALPAAGLVLSPFIGWALMKVFASNWFLGFLGQTLAIAKTLGMGFGALPKKGIVGLVFAPFMYLLVFGIAWLMSWADGVLSKSDPETVKLVNALVAALEKCGSASRIQYLEQKTMPPEQVSAVQKMQRALRMGATLTDAAQIAVLEHAENVADELIADKLTK
jgi:hypothetical protein